MAGKSAILTVKILTDASKAGTGLDQASGKFDKFKSGMSKMAVPAGIAIAAIAKFGKEAFDSASRTQQAMGAVESVFGKSAGAVERWAGGAAESVGLAKSEYGELASILGAQLKNMGIPMGQVAGKTKNLIKMGADLAATYGGTTAEAVDALGSALRGETDPIERYGISIKQADIAAQQAKDGTVKLTGAQGKAAKTAALLELATKQSADAHGAFAREADTAAGQQQRATAAMENASSAIGTALLPVVAKAAQLLAKLAKWVAENSTVVLILAGIIGVLAVAVMAVNAALWLIALNPVTLTILAVVAGVALLVGGLILLYKKSTTARNIMDKLWAGIKIGADAVKRFVTAAAQVFAAVFRVAVGLVKGYIRAWVTVIRPIFETVKTIIRAVVGVFKSAWNGPIQTVKNAVRSFRDWFRGIFDTVKTIVNNAVDALTGGKGLSGAIDAIVKTVGKIGETLGAPFVAISDAIGDVIDAIDSLIGWIAKIKLPDVGGWLSKVGGIIPHTAAPPTVPAGVTTLSAGARRPATGSAAAAGTPGPTIVVQGALDPEAVARQIQRILAGHNRRHGLRAAV